MAVITSGGGGGGLHYVCEDTEHAIFELKCCSSNDSLLEGHGLCVSLPTILALNGPLLLMGGDMG